MEKEIAKNIEYMSKSSQELARIMKSQKQAVQHMSKLVNNIPSVDPEFGDFSGIIENALVVSGSVSAYLYSLSSLAEAISVNLEYALKELRDPTAEE